MSTDPRPSTPTPRHEDLLAVLRGDSTAAVTPDGLPPAPADDPRTLLATSTSGHSRAVAAALTGAPLALRDTAGTLTAELLAALAADGRRVLLVAGSTTPLVRAELARVGLSAVLDGGTADQGSEQGRESTDTARWDQARARRRRTTLAVHTAPTAEVPTPFAVVAELLSLRAAGIDPPLVPSAAAWGVDRRAEVVDQLRAGSAPAPDGFADRSEQELTAAAADLDALPAALARLTALRDRLVAELGGRTPRTVGDLGRAAELLQQVEVLRSTYIPLALGTDLDAAQAVLDRRPRSLLSAEERDRRREVKRLGALRHDGSFGQQDVGTLRAVQRAWAEEFAGAPVLWPGRPDLAQALVTVRALLLRGGRAIGDLPEDPEQLELSRADALAHDARTLADAVRARLHRTALTRDGLDDLIAHLPAGTPGEDLPRFVRAVWLRALAPTRDDSPEPVAVFQALDSGRREAGARRVREELAEGRGVPVVVADLADAPRDGSFDVLVVDDAHRRPAGEVADLARNAHQLALVAPGGEADGGSAWSRGTTALAPVDPDWPPAQQDAATDAVRESVATALREAGCTVVVGHEVAGRTVDLLVAADAAGPQLAVDVDGPAHAALPTVQDRDVARPAQLDRAGHGHHLVPATAWFHDPAGQVQQVLDALAALTDRLAGQERLAREEAERAAAAAEREQAERATAEREQAEHEQAEHEQAAAQQPTAAPEPPAVVVDIPTAPAPTPATTPTPADEPLVLPKGLGRLDDAQALVAQFRADLGTAHPNVDHTPPGTVDAAVALAYAELGLGATDAAVVEAASALLGFRRGGVKVLRAFKESVQRSKKRMRGAGLRIS